MKAILFDLDDTLYPEITFVQSGFRAVSRHLAETESLEEKDLYRRMMRVLERNGRGEVFDTVLREEGLLRPGLVPKLVHLYRAHRPSINLFQDVEPGLNRLREMGVRTGVVTDGLASVQRSKVAALGLEPLVDTLVCTDEVGRDRGKPSVRPFLIALDTLRSAPAQAAYVGDDPSKDFQGPRKLGMVTIHMRRRGMQHRLAQGDADEADVRVETFEELVGKVGG